MRGVKRAARIELGDWCATDAQGRDRSSWAETEHPVTCRGPGPGVDDMCAIRSDVECQFEVQVPVKRASNPEGGSARVVEPVEPNYEQY